MRHMGAFSVVTNRAIVLPQPTPGDFNSGYHHVVRDQVFIITSLYGARSEVLGVSWPSVQEQVRFRMPNILLDVASQDGRTYYFTTAIIGDSTPLLAIAPGEGRGRRVGVVRDQFIRYPRFVSQGLSFVSLRTRDDAYVRSPKGGWRPIVEDGTVFRAVSCGSGVVVSRVVGARELIARFSAESDGMVALSAGPHDDFPACSPDGRVVFYVNRDRGNTIQRCDGSVCRPS